MQGRIKGAWGALAAVLALDAGVSAMRAITRRLPAADAAQPPARQDDTIAPGAAAAGAGAESPAQIPVRGWKQVLLRVFNQISEDRILTEAAAVTYYALLAIFPALTALISLYGLVADPATVGRNLEALGGVLPQGGMQILAEQIHSLTAAPNKALGIGALAGLLVSLWSANAGVKSLFDALDAVYEERETRSFLHRTWLSMAFTLGALGFVILAMSAVVVLPAVLHFLGLGPLASVLLSAGRWPVLLAALMVFLAFLYRFGPARVQPKWRWVSWGSAFATLTWIAGSAAFSWYVANFGSYNKTYGSLGAAVGFMTWIWISAIIVLVGAELNAQLEHQTARDSTVGPGRPMGGRGATYADRVAAG
jgi:membrane protein